MNENLVNTARERFEHASAKRILKEKYEAKMIFAFAGGMWRAGPELQTTLLTCPGTESVILDLYETPVKVVTDELYKKSQQHWQEQMNAWLVEYETINKSR